MVRRYELGLPWQRQPHGNQEVLKAIILLTSLCLAGCLSPAEVASRRCPHDQACWERTYAEQMRMLGAGLDMMATSGAQMQATGRQMMSNPSLHTLQTPPPAPPEPMPMLPPELHQPIPSAEPPPQFIPYGSVAPFMPGIGPDGTAR
jgi:hypothetical protein